MLSLFSSPRRALIVAHDLLMTAVAVVASCYIRFEAVGVEERLGTLLPVLPAFVVYAGVIHFLFHLYEAKWRFASLPDLYEIVRASSVLAVSLLIVDYFLVAPNVFGQYFFGKITIALYWILQIVLLSGSRMAYRYFRYTRTRHRARSPESNRRWCSAALPTPRCCCAASKAAPSPISGRPAFCRRRRPIAGKASAAFRCAAITRCSITSSTISRNAAPPSRATSCCRRSIPTPSRKNLDARAPARAHRQPAAVAR